MFLVFDSKSIHSRKCMHLWLFHMNFKRLIKRIRFSIIAPVSWWRRRRFSLSVFQRSKHGVDVWVQTHFGPSLSKTVKHKFVSTDQSTPTTTTTTSSLFDRFELDKFYCMNKYINIMLYYSCSHQHFRRVHVYL